MRPKSLGTRGLPCLLRVRHNANVHRSVSSDRNNTDPESPSAIHKYRSFCVLGVPGHDTDKHYRAIADYDVHCPGKLASGWLVR